jgi:2-succinyl-5-enolpyruvyl-6-hydroxy-3-cyclohexene-1-carboxylate synthase
MSSNLHLAWAQLFWKSLTEAGVTRVVVSPGSRSTPLALAALQTAALRVLPVIDEREAAFMALGASRADGVPTALLCTSGSAVAQWHAAIVEASLAFIPLVAVSADRPWEAQGCGASQTIPQARMFGEHVRAVLELGAPEATEEALRAVRRIAARAVALSRGPTPGPVHVNAAFRKPLEPVDAPQPEPWAAALAAVEALGAVTVHPADTTPSPQAVATLARAIRRARRGVIVAGPSVGPAASSRALGELSALSGFPVLVEAASGSRFGPHADAFCGGFDAFLRARPFREGERPDLVLQLGMSPVSTALTAWLGAARGPRVVVAPHGWNDPDGLATEVLAAEVGATVDALRAELGSAVEAQDPSWRARFDHAEAIARRAATTMQEGTTLTEPMVARALRDALPDEAWVLVSNSRPIRDLDSFVTPGGKSLQVFHQRGAAGIDGLLAGATGAAFALSRPGALLLGDVALAHDVAGLALLREVQTPLPVVVVDNGGGRIFDELPLARRPELADARARLFTTAPQLDVARIASAFGVASATVETPRALSEALDGALQRRGATVVVAVVPRGGEPPREALARAVARELP